MLSDIRLMDSATLVAGVNVRQQFFAEYPLRVGLAVYF